MQPLDSALRTEKLQAWLDDAGPVVTLSADGWLAPLRPGHGSATVHLLLAHGESLDQVERSMRALRASGDPDSRLVVGFTPSTSASAMIDVLSGLEVRGQLSESELLERAGQAGLVVARRAVFRREPLGLASDAATALSNLMTGLNPATGVDYVLLELRGGEAPPQVQRPGFEPGLLSVVMRNHRLDREHWMDQALFSLATQHHRPLELVVVSQARAPDTVERLTALIQRHALGHRFSFKVLHRPSSEDLRARLVNDGIAVARGQYLAFLDDDDVVYPDHYARLIKALKEGQAAWAISAVKRAYFTKAPDGTPFCVRKDVFPHTGTLDLGRLAHDNYVTCHSYVVDRFRTGAFPIGFDERLTKGEDYALVLRLLSVFRPAALGARPTCEYRIRDDGTNTIVHDTPDELARAERIKEWVAALDYQWELTRELPFLLGRREFIEAMAYTPGEAEPPAPRPELRYRMVDAANEALKNRLPGLHLGIKKLAGWPARKKQG